MRQWRLSCRCRCSRWHWQSTSKKASRLLGLLHLLHLGHLGQHLLHLGQQQQLLLVPVEQLGLVLLPLLLPLQLPLLLLQLPLLLLPLPLLLLPQQRWVLLHLLLLPLPVGCHRALGIAAAINASAAHLVLLAPPTRGALLGVGWCVSRGGQAGTPACICCRCSCHVWKGD